MKLFVTIFSIVGLALLGATIYQYSSTSSFLKTAIVAPGVVTDLTRSTSRDSDGNNSTTYYPQVRFTAQDGREIDFSGDVGTNPPAYSVGEKIEVLYTPESPEDAKINGFWSLWFGAVLTGVMGTIFAGVALGFIIAGMRKKALHDWLMTNGRVVEAKYTGIAQNTSYKVNGRSPWVIAAQWQDPVSQKVYRFESDNIWFDPTDYVKRESMTVRIDPQNPKRHWMDISFLPQMA